MCSAWEHWCWAMDVTGRRLTRESQSSPAATPPSTGATTGRASPKAPGGPATAIRRKAAADRADKVANARPASTRSAGAGGSSSTMLKLYTDESAGLKVDPFVVMVLSIGFIISVVALHSESPALPPAVRVVRRQTADLDLV